VISYGLSLGGYGVNMQIAIVHLSPLSTVSSVKYLQKTLNEKYCPYFALGLISLGRLSHDCNILQARLSVVGSTVSGVGIQKTVLSWQVGGGLLGAQSPTCECYRLIMSESVY
jgi:hypothetical protein